MRLIKKIPNGFISISLSLLELFMLCLFVYAIPRNLSAIQAILLSFGLIISIWLGTMWFGIFHGSTDEFWMIFPKSAETICRLFHFLLLCSHKNLINKYLDIECPNIYSKIQSLMSFNSKFFNHSFVLFLYSFSPSKTSNKNSLLVTEGKFFLPI